MPRLSQRDAKVLTNRFQDHLHTISDRTTRRVDPIYDSLAGFRDDDLVKFIDLTDPAISAAKKASTSLASGYYSTLLGVAAPSINAAEVPVTFNAESAFIVVRKALADGHAFNDARAMGKSQAQAAVRNHTISTARQTGDVFVEKAGVSITGWQRSAEANACPWCQELESYTWPTSDSADFGHDRCHCTPVPLTD